MSVLLEAVNLKIPLNSLLHRKYFHDNYKLNDKGDYTTSSATKEGP